jgi:hypothetical protein
MAQRSRDFINRLSKHVPSVLEEQTVEFSVADPFYQACAAILGAANLGGVLYLRYLYSHDLLLLGACHVAAVDSSICMLQCVVYRYCVCHWCCCCYCVWRCYPLLLY